jgi:hypothetical protein
MLWDLIDLELRLVIFESYTRRHNPNATEETD